MKEIEEILKNNDMLKEIILSVSKGDWEIGVSIENGEIVSFYGKVGK